MPPGSLSTLAVMNPGPITAKKAARRNQTSFHPNRRTRCGFLAEMSWAECMQAMSKCSLCHATYLELLRKLVQGKLKHAPPVAMVGHALACQRPLARVYL